MERLDFLGCSEIWLGAAGTIRHRLPFRIAHAEANAEHANRPARDAIRRISFDEMLFAIQAFFNRALWRAFGSFAHGYLMIGTLVSLVLLNVPIVPRIGTEEPATKAMGAESVVQSRATGLRGEPAAIAEVEAMVEAMGGKAIWAQLKSLHMVHEARSS